MSRIQPACIASTLLGLTLLASPTLGQTRKIDVRCNGAKIGEFSLTVNSRNGTFNSGGTAYRSLGADTTGGFVLTDGAARNANCWCESYRWFQAVEVTSTLNLGGGAPTFGNSVIADPFPTTQVEWGGGVVTADYFPFYWGNPAGACGHSAATGRNPVPGMPGKTWDLYFEDGPGLTFPAATPPGAFTTTFDFVTCLACVTGPLKGDGRNSSGSFKVLGAIRWSVTMSRNAQGAFSSTVGAPVEVAPGALPPFVATSLTNFNTRPNTGTWSLTNVAMPCPPPRIPRVGPPLLSEPALILEPVPITFDPLTQQLEIPAMPPLFLDDSGIDGPTAPQFLNDPVLDGVFGSLTYNYIGPLGGGQHLFLNDTQGVNLFVDDPLDAPDRTFFIDPLLPTGIYPGNPNGWLSLLGGPAPVLIYDPLDPFPLTIPLPDPLGLAPGSPLSGSTPFMGALLPPVPNLGGMELAVQGVLAQDLVQATQNFTQPAQLQLEPFVLRCQPAPVGQPFCLPVPPNSTGLSAELFGTGSPFVGDNFFELHTIQLPPFSAGFVLASPGQVFVPNPGGSQGNLCIGPAIGRGVGGVIFNSGADGTAVVLADLFEMPTPNGHVPVQPGSQLHFQTWYRDSAPTGATSNLSNGLGVLFQ